MHKLNRQKYHHSFQASRRFLLLSLAIHLGLLFLLHGELTYKIPLTTKFEILENPVSAPVVPRAPPIRKLGKRSSAMAPPVVEPKQMQFYPANPFSPFAHATVTSTVPINENSKDADSQTWDLNQKTDKLARSCEIEHVDTVCFSAAENYEVLGKLVDSKKYYEVACNLKLELACEKLQQAKFQD